VAIRSTLTPGRITVTAKRNGLASATMKIESKPVEIVGGLTRALPQTLSGLQGASQEAPVM
jgi:beta-galactosidase